MTDDTLPMTDERAAFEAWRETQAWYEVTKPRPGDEEGDGSMFRLMNIAASSAWDARASLASPAAPHPAQQAGDMVMVPRVPTEEMMYRGGEATSGLVDWGADSFPDDAPGNLASAVYAAMLTAAPAIPAQQAGQPEDAKDAARYRLLRSCRGQEHDPPFRVINELDDDLIWGADLDAAVDTIRAMSSPTAKKGE